MRRRYVVSGPLGSGTSTYVREHAQPGDLVWDWDIVARTLTPGLEQGMPVLGPPWLVGVLLGMRAALVNSLEVGAVDPPGVFIIATNKSTASLIASQIHAEVVPIGE